MNLPLGSTVDVVILTLNPSTNTITNLVGTEVPTIKIITGNEIVTPLTAPIIVKIPNTIGMYSVSFILDKTRFFPNKTYTVMGSYTVVGITGYTREVLYFRTIAEDFATKTDMINVVWKTVIDGGKDLRWLATLMLSNACQKMNTSNFDKTTISRTKTLYNSKNQILLESKNNYTLTNGEIDGSTVERTCHVENMTMEI